MTDFEDRLRNHYRGMKLDSVTLSDIIDGGNSTLSGRLTGFMMRRQAMSWAAAAVVLLSITLGMHQYGTNSERTLRTLHEAAMNHSTRLQLEFKADSIGEIDRQMSQLQFTVALPSDFDEQLEVVGARYCTINGELAAHVKLIDRETNRQTSLFMAQSADGLRTIDATQKQIDGVNVKLWSETGLFYAMASRSLLIQSR